MFLDENSLKIRFLDKKHHCPGFLAPFVAARLQASRQRIIYFFVFFQKKIRQLTHRSFNLEKKKKLKIKARGSGLIDQYVKPFF